MQRLPAVLHLKRQHILATLACVCVIAAAVLVGCTSDASSNLVQADLADSRSSASAEIGPAPAAADTDVTLEFVGLTPGTTLEVYVVEPAPGGGFYRRQAIADVATVIHVAAGRLVEAAPILIGPNERYQASSRFQSPATGTHLIYRFEKRFHVTLSSWSRGTGTAGARTDVQGSLSRRSDWVVAGQILTVVATPFPGMKFDHWGVFDTSERAAIDRVSFTDPALHLTVTRPLHVLAGFTPR